MAGYSVNNIFLMATEPPVKKYQKAIVSQVGGTRLDSDNKQVYFILKSGPDGFDYEYEVLEVYSDREDKFIRQANRKLFELGMLKEYIGDIREIDTTNLLTDDQIRDIAGTTNVPSLLKKLQELTSTFTVQRVLDTAKEIGRPAKTLDLIANRLKELNG